ILKQENRVLPCRMDQLKAERDYECAFGTLQALATLNCQEATTPSHAHSSSYFDVSFGSLLLFPPDTPLERLKPIEHDVDLDICHLPPGPGNGCTYTSYRPVSFEV